MIARIWAAMLAAGSLRFWAQTGAGMALTLVFMAYGTVIWRGPWPQSAAPLQLELLGQGQLAAALMVLVALVCITGMKLGISGGKDGFKADVERDDENATRIETVTQTTVTPPNGAAVTTTSEGSQP